MSRNMENCVEFISGDMTCTASFTNQKHINRMKNCMRKTKKNFRIWLKMQMEVFAQNFRFRG